MRLRETALFLADMIVAAALALIITLGLVHLFVPRVLADERFPITADKTGDWPFPVGAALSDNVSGCARIVKAPVCFRPLLPDGSGLDPHGECVDELPEINGRTSVLVRVCVKEAVGEEVRAGLVVDVFPGERSYERPRMELAHMDYRYAVAVEDYVVENWRHEEVPDGTRVIDLNDWSQQLANHFNGRQIRHDPEVDEYIEFSNCTTRWESRYEGVYCDTFQSHDGDTSQDERFVYRELKNDTCSFYKAHYLQSNEPEPPTCQISSHLVDPGGNEPDIMDFRRKGSGVERYIFDIDPPVDPSVVVPTANGFKREQNAGDVEVTAEVFVDGDGLINRNTQANVYVLKVDGSTTTATIVDECRLTSSGGTEYCSHTVSYADGTEPNEGDAMAGYPIGDAGSGEGGFEGELAQELVDLVKGDPDGVQGERQGVEADIDSIFQDLDDLNTEIEDIQQDVHDDDFQNNPFVPQWAAQILGWFGNTPSCPAVMADYKSFVVDMLAGFCTQWETGGGRDMLGWIFYVLTAVFVFHTWYSTREAA